jgi:general secretion pathway protein D
MPCRVHIWAVLGFCAMLTLAVDVPPVPAQTSNAAYVNFSFDQVDLRLLAKLVGEMTGKRFVVDNSISGKVTVVSPPQIPIDEIYPLFLSILESSGYSVVEKENAYYLVPLPPREVATAPVVGAEEKVVTGGLVTKVIRLQNVSAVEIKRMLEPMVRGGKTGALAAFGPTNHLIVTDTGENVRRIEQIIAELDKPGAARIVEVVKLEHADAGEVGAELMAALRGAQSAESALSKHIQQVAEGAGALPSDVVVVPALSANSLVLVGTPVQMNEVKRIVQMMDVETQPGFGKLNAIFLKYLSADEAAKSLNALLAKTTDKDQRQRIAIEPSKENNALVVHATPQDYEVVRALVERLDQMPQQVMVEILIAEIGVDKNVDFGVEWSTIQAPEDGKTTVIGRSHPDDTDRIMDLATKGVSPQGLSVGVARGFFTDSTGVRIPRIPFLVRALAQDRDVKILSNVPLWAQNNTEASVSVVENIPVLRSTIEGGSGTARDVIQNIDRLDVGIKLKFTPHVNPDRKITMQLNPSIEAVIDPGSLTTQFTPTIAKREVSTTVTVQDQATVIISGLIRDDRVKVEHKVPLLGDIPMFGALFRSTSDEKKRTNLLIFVTPHIVTDVEEAAVVGQTLRAQSGMDVSPTNLAVRDAKGR